MNTRGNVKLGFGSFVVPRENVISTLFLLVTILWSVSIDLFNIKTETTQISNALFQRFISSPNYDSQHQSKVSVFLINDEYLSDSQLFWPLDYSSQLKLLAEILGKNPKAIYLDFLYQHPHEKYNGELQYFVNGLLNVAKEQGDIPIIVPKFLSSSHDFCGSNVHDGGNVTTEPLLSIFEQSDIKKSYVSYTGCGRFYPLQWHNGSQYPSPARTMFEIYCEQTSTCSLSGELTDYPPPMDIQWGANISQQSFTALQRRGVQCQPHVDGTFERFWYRLKQLGLLLTFSHNEASLLPCPYTDTFYANWVVDRPMAVDKLFTTMIKDRYVFIGVNLQKSYFVKNPINGHIAGVYQHAMAFDNLLTYSDNYIRPPERLTQFFYETAQLILLMTLLYVLTRVFLLPGGLTVFDAYRYGLWIRMTSLLIIFAIIPLCFVLACVVVSFQLAYSPSDWIGILLAAIVCQMNLDRASIKWVLLGSPLSRAVAD